VATEEEMKAETKTAKIIGGGGEKRNSNPTQWAIWIKNKKTKQEME